MKSNIDLSSHIVDFIPIAIGIIIVSLYAFFYSSALSNQEKEGVFVHEKQEVLFIGITIPIKTIGKDR